MTICLPAHQFVYCLQKELCLRLCAASLLACMRFLGLQTKDKFQKQKDQVIGESKENIKEAEKTLRVSSRDVVCLMY